MTFFCGRWVDECECGCGAPIAEATGTDMRDGKLILVACTTAQNRALEVFKVEWQRKAILRKAKSL